MQEMSKATKRRYQDPAYHLHFFAGNGLDIGGGDDPLGRWCHAFARMKSCRTWDKADGDASWLDGIEKAVRGHLDEIRALLAAAGTVEEDATPPLDGPHDGELF